MEEDRAESEDSYLSQLPNELKLRIILPLIEEIIEEIVNDSKSIFEAYTKFSRSKSLKNILSVDANFRAFSEDINKVFVRLLNEKFPNYFIENTKEENNEELKKLLDITQTEFSSENEILAAQAILAGADANLQIGTNPTNPVLIESIKNRHNKLAQLLIEHGADINGANNQGDTPLIVAVKDSPDIVKILLEYEADPNIPNKSRQTPLMFAALNMNEKITQQLLDHAADPRIEDEAGNTALKIAKRTKHKNIKKLLKNALSKYRAHKCSIS